MSAFFKSWHDVIGGIGMLMMFAAIMRVAVFFIALLIEHWTPGFLWAGLFILGLILLIISALAEKASMGDWIDD